MKIKVFLLSLILAAQMQAKIDFKDVIGLPEVKQKLNDVVGFLQKPEKYKSFGATVSRGVLLIGASGTGKSLVAKAIAGEANCVIYQITRATLVGLTAAQVIIKFEEVFTQARNTSPCVVLIEELDVLLNNSGANKNDFVTKLILLLEQLKAMQENLIVIATATNFDQIDKSLLTVGRFDCHVHMPNLDLPARELLFKAYLTKAKLDPALDLNKLARMTMYWQTGEILDLINKAVLLAISHDRTCAGMLDFEEARTKFFHGERKEVMSEHERKVTAYHEAGHALVMLMLPGLSEPLYKVTIVSHSNSLGNTSWLPERESVSYNQYQYLARIAVSMGGRAAEELVFDVVTSGPAGDIVVASRTAREMVCRNGMAPQMVGLAFYGQQTGNYQYSQAMAEKIDLAVMQILNDSYARAKQILADNRDKLDKLAQALLEKETLDASEVYELLEIAPR